MNKGELPIRVPEAARKMELTYGDFLMELEKLCQDGATMDEVAEHFLVERREVSRWRRELFGVREAMRVGWAGAKERIERRLVDSAIDGNVDAGKFILERRAPGEWGRQKESGEKPVVLDLTQLLESLREIGRAEAKAITTGVTVEGEQSGPAQTDG